MDDKTIIDITNLDQFSPKKNIRNFFLKDWRRTMVL